jgi:hypothetical protein
MTENPNSQLRTPNSGFTADHAKAVVADCEALLKKLEGLAGPAVNIRFALEGARDLAAKHLSPKSDK